jgi:hypothetical protein
LIITLLAPFLIVTTASGHRLTLSPDHYVRIFDAHHTHDAIYITAGNLTINQTLMVVLGMEGQNNHSIIYSPIVSITKTNLVGVYNVLTYSGSLIVSRIVASCYISGFGSHERIQLRFTLIRLWRRVAIMLNFIPFIDEFTGVHPFFDSRLFYYVHWHIPTIYDYISFILSSGIPVIIFVSFFSIFSKTIFSIVSKVLSRLSPSYN